ncbi:hypothetical protein EDB19DRAFT_1749232 [Suillus lakei]|nr:hypothetical protein EDB19DRAFT_1749232 [Suillus lakei]
MDVSLCRGRKTSTQEYHRGVDWDHHLLNRQIREIPRNVGREHQPVTVDRDDCYLSLDYFHHRLLHRCSIFFSRGNGSGWHLTLAATRLLKVLYFDGSSAAKVSDGTMYTQDIIA